MQQVHDGSAPCRAARFGDLIAGEGVHPALVGKEQNGLVGIDDADVLGVVVLPGGHGADALAAPALSPVGGLGQALHVPKVGQRDHHIVHGDQVGDVDFALDGGNLRAPGIGELVFDFGELVLDDAQQLLLVIQKGLEIGDGLFQFLIFFQQLFPLQAGQAGQAHIQNGLGLLVGKVEALH